MLWHQGESDRHQARNYYHNLKQMITYILTYLVDKTGNKKYAECLSTQRYSPLRCRGSSGVGLQDVPTHREKEIMEINKWDCVMNL